MTLKKFNRWIDACETACVFIFLLYFIGTNPAPTIAKALNALSYPIIGLIVCRRYKHFFYVASQSPLLLILVIYTVASFIWSVNLQQTVANLRGLLRTTAFGVYIASKYSIKEQIRLFYAVHVSAGILSYFYGLFLPYGQHFINGAYAWRGAFPHKNFLARAMAIGSMMCINIALNKDEKHRTLALVSFWLCLGLLVLSSGKGSTVLLVIMICILPLYILVRQYYKAQIFIYAVMATLVLPASIFIFQNLETILVDILGRDLSLNGRIPLWQLFVEKIFERPLFGYGYAAFFSSEEVIDILRSTWAPDDSTSFYAHNGYIETALGGGLFGLLLLLVYIIKVLWDIIAYLFVSRRLEVVFALQFVIFIILFNAYDGIGLLSASNAMWSMLISLHLSIVLESRRVRRNYPVFTGIDSWQ